MMKGCTRQTNVWWRAQASEDRNVEGTEDEYGVQKHENNK